MKLYLWNNYASFDEELLSEKIFNVLACNTDNVSAIENGVESEWDNVEIRDTTVYEIYEYMRNGVIFLEHGCDE